MNRETGAPTEALLYAAEPPSLEQRARFLAFLESRYGKEIPLRFVHDESKGTGFLLVVGSDQYDWTLSGRYRQLHETIQGAANPEGKTPIALIREKIESFEPSAAPREVGRVLRVADHTARVSGLGGAFFGEILYFESGIRGMVRDLAPDGLGCILFGDDRDVVEGSRVYRTEREAGIPVGEGFLGRVVNALGVPIDGQGPIASQDFLPMESPAPGILDREAVNEPLETGLLTIDAMFPIGKGQRELIIGDRQTGKTTIALDTILNQKDSGIVCIYVAIGQKNSSVARLVETLRRADAMKTTVVVSASAGESSSLQYIAPYAGCAMGEFFMRQGKDVLIIYDDLSKHAVAYRTLCLLLGRSPGREAYPGDVFYLHSRLLERAAHLSSAKGGGSMTALPIVETQAGDVSAYIPTNIISITDGQLFLETDLFYEGQRPAVNVGQSVSRVGSQAQTRAKKEAAGTIRLDLSQYREMEIFTQFASELDEVTKRQLRYGQSLMQLLRQRQHAPYTSAQQVVLLTAGVGHLFEEFEPGRVRTAAQELLAHMEKAQPVLMQTIENRGYLTEEEKKLLLDEASAFLRTLAQGEKKEG
ncbi:MAG: F0F1 ATP synthase subunit alpha [Lachnospiraceae bacterium]|nr:F0F1 ATP synthase subunit alpha [Lachnospiraceae bacterium]